MSDGDQSLVIPTLVYLGATILIGVPTMIVTMEVLTSVSGVALDALGVEEIPSVGGILLLATSVVIGLQIAVEATALQLGGIEALRRGSPRVALVRYIFLSLCVFVALAAVTWVGFTIAVAESGWAAIILGVLVGCAGFSVLYRSSYAFITGFRDNGA